MKKLELVNNIILLDKLEYLNDPKFFEDGVHLGKEYMFGYKEVIMNGLVYMGGQDSIILDSTDSNL